MADRIVYQGLVNAETASCVILLCDFKQKSAVGSKNLRSKQHSAPVHFEFTSQLKLLTIEKKATTESIKKKQASQSHLLSDLTW